MRTAEAYALRVSNRREPWFISTLVEPQVARARPRNQPARSETPITRPPIWLGLDPFYRKHVSAGGLPIVASGRVSDEALLRARRTIMHMLEHRPDIRRALIENRVRVAIIGRGEETTDLPEYRDLPHPRTGRTGPEARAWWNARARGLGPTLARPVISAGEENILRLSNDRYAGESILVHEFAHAIGLGLRRADRSFDDRLQAAFEHARAKGLYIGTYAATNAEEYWAEGTQAWFNVNAESFIPNGAHNRVNTRRELSWYDPELAALLQEVFG